MVDKKKISEIIIRVCQITGYKVYDWQLKGYGKDQRLVVQITHPDGVTIDDCAKFSHTLGDELDMRDVFAKQYLLEVSSPGLTRDLTKKEHFADAVGEKIKIRFRNENNHIVTQKGIVSKVDEDAVYLNSEKEDSEVKAVYDKIKKAKTIFKLENN